MIVPDIGDEKKQAGWVFAGTVVVALLAWWIFGEDSSRTDRALEVHNKKSLGRSGAARRSITRSSCKARRMNIFVGKLKVYRIVTACSRFNHYPSR